MGHGSIFIVVRMVIVSGIHGRSSGAMCKSEYLRERVGDVPFSHLCLRLEPSFPFSRASRRFMLSRRSGSLR